MKEQLTDSGSRLMNLMLNTKEKIYPYAENRAKTFGIIDGMTIVDYGCGPGCYTIPFAQIVGKQGKVIGVDLSKIALEKTEQKAKKKNLNNIILSLAKGYESNIDSEIADIVFALDMFFMVENPNAFLKELYRICKKDGILIIDDGHQSRESTKKKIIDSEVWDISEENKGFLKCKKTK